MALFRVVLSKARAQRLGAVTSAEKQWRVTSDEQGDATSVRRGLAAAGPRDSGTRGSRPQQEQAFRPTFCLRVAFPFSFFGILPTA